MQAHTNIDDLAVPPAPGTLSPVALPAHLVPLPDAGWALWRWAGLRGAGFPIDQVLSLATPACAAQADLLIQAEAAHEAAREAVLDALRRAADHADPAERLVFIRALQNFKKGKGVLPEVPGVTAAAEVWRGAAERYAAARTDFQQSFKAATLHVSEMLRALAGDSALREAITWQNHHALETGLDVLLRTPPGGSSSKIRQKEVLVANYVQRYSAKNDTIGFFGPIGWVQIHPAAGALTLRPGAGLLATRNVYFETWSIDALAEALTQDEALLPWIAPRRLPFVRVEGTTLYLPLANPIKLKPPQAAVLAACDGRRTAQAIAHALLENRSLGFQSEADVYAVLKLLQRQRRIVWSLEVPSEGAYPERYLRQQLSRIEDQALKASTSAALDELEAARDAVARAGGDAAALQAAFQRLETTFTALTGAAATRYGGKNYAARTLVYEDCRRDVEVQLGADLLRAISAPLTLFLASARWLTYETAQAFRRAFREVYDELVQKTGARTVDFAAFWLLAQPLISLENSLLVDALLDRLQALWTDEILGLTDERGCVSYTSAELRERVFKVFAAPATGWLTARYHSPDIMIAAESVAAIQRGDYQLVLGEFHVGLNTLNASLFVLQHPDPDQLREATEWDLPAPVFLPILPKQWPAPTVRGIRVLTSAKDLRLATGIDACAHPAARVLPSAALVVEAAGDDLIVRIRDGADTFEIIEVLSEYVTAQVMSRFKPIASRPYLPRIVIDRLVVNRETWRVPAAELPFARLEAEAERFVATRRWAQQRGLPRWVFVKAPVEQKPFYVDFDSPIYIDIFARVIRRCLEQDPAAAITIGEMLPGPDQLWLRDQAGGCYTSELRLVTVDLEIEADLLPYRLREEANQ